MLKDWLAFDDSDFKETILDCMGDGVVAADCNGFITYMNPAAAAILGCGADERRGAHFDSVFTLRDFDSGDSQESLFSKTMLSCSSIGLRNRSVLKANDGTEKFISANCARILPPGNECDKAGPIGIIMVFRDVTSFKNHEIGIVNEKNNFINILNHIPSLIWKSNQEGECDYVNKVWSEFTGKSMEQAAGSMWQNVIHPDDIGYYMKKFDEARFKRETYEIEARYLRWDGEFRWCLDRGSPYYEMDGTYTGYIGSIIDITPRKLAEKELLQSRTKYHSLFMNMHNGYVEFRLVFDKDGRPDDLRVIEINAAFARICSMTQEFMQGRLFTELFPNVRAIMEKVFLEYERTLSKGESLEIHEGYSAEADRWYDLSIYSPQKEHIVMLISDITHMKKVERRLKESALAAEAANNAKSEFLANMSHEIRTPINGMLGMIDLTLNSKLDEEQKDNLDIAKKCAMSLLNIINDILDFSKIEAGKLSIRNLDFSIYKLIEELVRTHAPRAEAKGLELFYSFSSSVPEYLKGDPSRVRQILDNFASNAIKFTEKGKVNIEVKKTLEKENAVGLKFSVSDTGIGITSDDMSRLFKVFSQIDSSFTKKYSGTGLGLVISKQLAEIMGGGIEVESEPGKGSTFSLLMEFQPGTKPEDKPASAASGAMTENPADKSFEAEEVVRRLRILVAEDEPINRLVISKMLIEKGYQVVSVENGMEAVEQFAGGSFDIVLMDIQMPLMNGIEATKRIRELEGNSSHIPIVAITAFALLGDREKFLSAGMDEYLTKPTKMSDLIATIERMTADGKASGGMPERVSINEKGEVVFVSCDHESFEKRSISIKHAAEKHLCDMGCQLGKLNQAMEKLDLEKMGQIAHKIKGICSDMEADDMKYNAFNIELAARRGNLEDACINVRLLESLFNTFKEPMSNEAGN